MPPSKLPSATIRLLVLVAIAIGLGAIGLEHAADESWIIRLPFIRRRAAPKAEVIQLAAARLEELLAAPTFVEINGTRLWLKTYVWRNMMPTYGPSNGGGLIASLVVTDGADISGRPSPFRPRRVGDLPMLEIEHAWILLGDQAWSISSFEPDPSNSHHKAALAAIARQGPNWPCDAEVMTVIRVRDVTGGSHLIRGELRSVICAY